MNLCCIQKAVKCTTTTSTLTIILHNWQLLSLWSGFLEKEPVRGFLHTDGENVGMSESAHLNINRLLQSRIIYPLYCSSFSLVKHPVWCALNIASLCVCSLSKTCVFPALFSLQSWFFHKWPIHELVDFTMTEIFRIQYNCWLTRLSSVSSSLHHMFIKYG